MSDRIIRRLVTCQGSVQLVAAITCLRERENEDGAGARYEDYLVIYDLCAPSPDRTEEFALFIRRAAATLHPWKRILFLDPLVQESLLAEARRLSRPRLAEILLARVDADGIDEIYLSRNWQYGNRLFLNAFSGALKICYGDGIGVYIEPGHFDRSRVPLSRRMADGLRLWRDSWLESLGRRTVLRPVDFDRGYLVLPDAVDKPAMPVRTVGPDSLRQVFREFSLALRGEGRLRLPDAAGPLTILLTSNFSEGGWMRPEDEIRAYRDFILTRRKDAGGTLLVKPHPRDRRRKLEGLAEDLTDRFDRIVVLDEGEQAYVPFECFMMTLESGDADRLRVMAFSTAAFSLPLLFGVDPILGFGPELVEKYFLPSSRRIRLRHEKTLVNALVALQAARPEDRMESGLRAGDGG